MFFTKKQFFCLFLFLIGVLFGHVRQGFSEKSYQKMSPEELDALRVGGNPIAVFELCQRFLVGDDVERSIQQVRALVDVGERLLSRIGLARLKWLSGRKLSKREGAAALYTVGRWLELQNRQSEAIDYFRRAAEKDFVLAQDRFGEILASGAIDREDFESAFRLFKAAANCGLPSAMFNVACCYRDGKGVAKNLTAAQELFHWLAIQANMPQAQNALAMCYWFGVAVPMNRRQAFTYFEQSAEQHDIHGMYNYGLCFFNGDVVKRDVVKAAELFEKAAEKGVLEAQYVLGMLLARGEGVRQDLKRAERYLKLSADQGYFLGQRDYGFFLVKHDRLSEAWPYLKVAAEKGELCVMHFFREFPAQLRGLAMTTDQQTVIKKLKNRAERDPISPGFSNGRTF
jgi:TPR repeat protein